MLSLLGVQHLGIVASGQTLTVPALTVAVLVVAQRTTGGTAVSAMALGGESFTAQSVGTGQGDMFFCADASGRSSDVLSWTGVDAAITAFYISGVAPDIHDTDTGGFATSTSYMTSAPLNGGNVFGVMTGWQIQSGTMYTGYIDAAAFTAFGDPSNGTHQYGCAYAGPSALGAGDTVGITISPGAVVSHHSGVVWLYESDMPEVSPDPPGAEVGIPDTFEITQGPPVQWSFAIGGAEVGIPSGFRVTATGPASVMLAVPGRDRPQLTDIPAVPESGPDDPVLVYRRSRKPELVQLGELLSGYEIGSDLSSLHIGTATGTYDIDLAVAATHEITLTGNTELTPVGTAAADETIDLRLVLYPEEFDVTWGGTILWAGGSEPDLSGLTTGESVVIGFLSTDEGDTWRGFLAEPGSGSSVTLSDTVEDETTWGITPSAGVATTAARGDHTHGSPEEPTGTGDPGDDTHVWMPLTTVIDGDPELVWDEPSLSLIPTLVPLD